MEAGTDRFQFVSEETRYNSEMRSNEVFSCFRVRNLPPKQSDQPKCFCPKFPTCIFISTVQCVEFFIDCNFVRKLKMTVTNDQSDRAILYSAQATRRSLRLDGLKYAFGLRPVVPRPRSSQAVLARGKTTSNAANGPS